MLLDTVYSKVFGSSNVVMESALKNPNQFREAVLFEALSELPEKKIKEFINSPEAKTMLSEGIITQETLERLANEHKDGLIATTVCHMAKENGDPLWDEFVAARIQERRLMNDLLEKYGDKAQPIADDADKRFVEACIPEYFR